jgi:hypothetical protein
MWFAEALVRICEPHSAHQVEIAQRKLIPDEHGEWREVNPVETHFILGTAPHG